MWFCSQLSFWFWSISNLGSHFVRTTPYFKLFGSKICNIILHVTWIINNSPRKDFASIYNLIREPIASCTIAQISMDQTRNSFFFGQTNLILSIKRSPYTKGRLRNIKTSFAKESAETLAKRGT